MLGMFKEDAAKFISKALKASKAPLFTINFSFWKSGEFRFTFLRGPWVAMRNADLHIDVILVNPAQGFDFRVAGDTQGSFDCESQAVILDTGQIGHLWGAKVIENKDVPEGTLVFLGREPHTKVTDKFQVGVLIRGVA